MKLLMLIIFLFTLSSCSSWMSILVKIIDINKGEESLEIEFTFKDKSLRKNVNILNIMIFKNDDLQYELEVDSDTTNLTRWQFPQMPKGFKIIFPKDEKLIKTFNKTDKITFKFSGHDNKRGVLGEWHFKPSYLSIENRWMFDKEGNKIVNIESSYESWIGKDIIKIYSNSDLNIDNESLKLINSNKEEIDFKIRSQKNNHKIVVLTLKQDLKKGEILNLTFKNKDGNSYSDKVIGKGKSNVGIIGKYR